MAYVKMVILTAALAIGAALSLNSPASAVPLSPSTGGNDLKASVDATSPLIEVRHWYGRRGYYGGAGFATGVIIGSGLASPYYYRPYYYAPPAYYAPPPYAVGDPVAYCMQRFRSYDPYSRTYLGYDGLRHPCP
jgi:hypothetical protein